MCSSVFLVIILAVACLLKKSNLQFSRKGSSKCEFLFTLLQWRRRKRPHNDRFCLQIKEPKGSRWGGSRGGLGGSVEPLKLKWKTLKHVHFKLVKTCGLLWQRRNSLAWRSVMSTRYEKPNDCDAVVQLRFAEQQPRRMLLVDLIIEETQAWFFSQ